mmetsp:Transcript_9158/g.26249  ORF Transcript_9158/g.26249 Transcript_9158/m.26249 type:complete len:274 (+) Transcript_9158:95-916(+)
MAWMATSTKFCGLPSSTSVSCSKRSRSSSILAHLRSFCAFSWRSVAEASSLSASLISACCLAFRAASFSSFMASNLATRPSVWLASQLPRTSFTAGFPTCSGSSPCSLPMRGSAPPSRSGSMQSSFPRKAARHSGERLNSPCELGSAPRPSSSFNMVTSPPAAASDRRVFPWPSATSTTSSMMSSASDMSFFRSSTSPSNAASSMSFLSLATFFFLAASSACFFRHLASCFREYSTSARYACCLSFSISSCIFASRSFCSLRFFLVKWPRMCA